MCSGYTCICYFDTGSINNIRLEDCKLKTKTPKRRMFVQNCQKLIKKTNK